MKKLISKVLIVSMVLSLFVSNSLAAHQIDSLEQKKQEVLASVEAQLRAQDALYMMDYFAEVVEEMYSPHVPTRASSYYAPNGGWMTGTISVVTSGIAVFIVSVPPQPVSRTALKMRIHIDFFIWVSSFTLIF